MAHPWDSFRRQYVTAICKCSKTSVADFLFCTNFGTAGRLEIVTPLTFFYPGTMHGRADFYAEPSHAPGFLWRADRHRDPSFRQFAPRLHEKPRIQDDAPPF